MNPADNAVRRRLQQLAPAVDQPLRDLVAVVVVAEGPVVTEALREHAITLLTVTISPSPSHRSFNENAAL